MVAAQPHYLQIDLGHVVQYSDRADTVDGVAIFAVSLATSLTQI